MIWRWFRPRPLPLTERLAYVQRFVPEPKPMPSWRVLPSRPQPERVRSLAAWRAKWTA